MPTQVLPITDLAKAGVIMDMPAVSLPPNVFSDCRNVRFRDGAIRKMEGEQEIFFSIGASDIIFAVFWPEPSMAPNDGYIILIGRNNTSNLDTIYMYRASTRTLVRQQAVNDTVVPGRTQWQHTFFGGGTTLILNNGVSRPLYVNGPINEAELFSTRTFFNLPGWDSYLADEQVTSFFYDTAFITDIGTDLGTFVNLRNRDDLTGIPTSTEDQAILVSVIPADERVPPFQLRIDDYNDTVGGTGNAAAGTGEPGVPVVGASIGYNGTPTVAQPDLTDTGTSFVTFSPREYDDAGMVVQQGVLPGDSVTIRIQTIPDIQVRAGVIRAYGDLLVAGNLTEFMRSDPSQTVRSMPGVIRTSDVAAPGSVPANWNPFKTGVNTADEFTLSSTGIVQDMAELQGILYVYTNDSIHSVQQTGNTTLPFNVRPVARGWGAQTIDAVQEFDGRHIVIGSSDIYVFQGHPGSIQSIADTRVRRFFFTRLHPDYEQNLFTLLYRRRDEIWINYPNMDSAGQCNETLIWNYRNNTWTVRSQSQFWNGTMAPIQGDGSIDPNEYFPLLTSTDSGTSTDSVFIADATGTFNLIGGTFGYESYVERKRLAMTPEFTTENLLSVAMLTELAEGVVYEDPVNLRVNATGTSRPAEDTDLRHDINGQPNPGLGVTALFNINEDYKVDLREHGRLLNHRITDNRRDIPWALVGLQFDIGTGGTR